MEPRAKQEARLRCGRRRRPKAPGPNLQILTAQSSGTVGAERNSANRRSAHTPKVLRPLEIWAVSRRKPAQCRMPQRWPGALMEL